MLENGLQEFHFLERILSSNFPWSSESLVDGEGVSFEELYSREEKVESGRYRERKIYIYKVFVDFEESVNFS